MNYSLETSQADFYGTTARSTPRLVCDVFSQSQPLCSVEDGASELLNKPEFGIVFADALEFAHASSARLSLGHSVAGALQHDVEVHAENTRGRVVLNSEVDMLINSKSKVAYTRKSIKHTKVSK